MQTTPLTCSSSSRASIFFPACLAAGWLASAAGAQGVVFKDIALETNTLNLSFGRAAATADFDGDGLLDIVCADAFEPNQFYRQKSDGTFEDSTSLWGVGNVVEYHWGVLAADFDNDGDDDLYFGNGGFAENENPGRPFPNQLLRNDIQTSGVLTDVSLQSNDAINRNPTFGVTALDYDKDGFLDIYCSDVNRACTLLRNTGGLSFDDVSAQANITVVGDWRHGGVGDFDNDGWMDMGSANFNGPNVLYRNRQDGTFVDRAVQAGVDDPFENFGMVFQDYDNDGLVDLYIAKYQLTPMGPSSVYLNNGDGTLRYVSNGSGLGAHTDMGHESGDVDGDGFPDLLMGTGNPFFKDVDYLYLVTPNGSNGLNIVESSTVTGFNSAGATRQHGQCLFDYDRDGDIDIYCNNGGPSRLASTAESNLFWQNQGNGNAWTALEIEGVYSNRTGVGVHAKATTVEGTEVHRTLAVGRGFSNTPDHALHFGIGSDSAIERIELTWPSGIVQTIDQPVMSAYTQVVETGAILRGTPTIGQFFSYDFAGEAGDVVELGLSLSTTSIELDGINGTLALGGSYVLLPALPLDAGGRLTLPIPLPASPGLIGLTIHSQAWIHNPAELGTLSQLISFTIQ